MKNKETRPRCRVCSTYLFNYDSKVLGLCAEHRVKLPPHMMEEWRKVVRTKIAEEATTSKEAQ